MQCKNTFDYDFQWNRCHANTSLGLVWERIPCIPPVSAPAWEVTKCTRLWNPQGQLVGCCTVERILSTPMTARELFIVYLAVIVTCCTLVKQNELLINAKRHPSQLYNQLSPRRKCASKACIGTRTQNRLIKKSNCWAWKWFHMIFQRVIFYKHYA